MLNTSWSTHHYPTALALRVALSLSPACSLSVFDASWAGERDGTWGGGWGSRTVQMLSVKLSWHAVRKILTLWAHMDNEMVFIKKACKNKNWCITLQMRSKTETHQSKAFGLLGWFMLLAYNKLKASRDVQHEYWRKAGWHNTEVTGWLFPSCIKLWHWWIFSYKNDELDLQIFSKNITFTAPGFVLYYINIIIICYFLCFCMNS